MSSRLLLLIAVPFVLFLYPAAVLLLSTSEAPRILGKYSYGLAAFNGLAILLYAGAAAAAFRGSPLYLALATLALALFTYVVPTSNTAHDWPALFPLLATIRLVASFSLIAIAFAGMRLGRRVSSRLALVGGGLLIVPSAIDLGYLAAQALGLARPTVSIVGGHRTAYDLAKVTGHDIVIVGDSFVWGQAVEVDQRFGDVLQTLLRRRDPSARVYSLGTIGGGLPQYVQHVREVPADVRARRLIISFYQNDMPRRPSLDALAETVSLGVAFSSVSARLLVDVARLPFAPTVDQYMRSLLADHDQRQADYPRRWNDLVEHLRTLFALSVGRSVETPAFLIIPALSTTDGDQWLEIHRRVGRAASEAGFEVLDLFADFKVGTKAATARRVAPNDLHFDVEGNRLVAVKLFDLIEKK